MATNTYEEVLNWSVEDVAVWARAAHVNEETIGILAHPNNQISGRALITLTYLEYVNVCHVPIGRAFELMHAISALKADFGPNALVAAPLWRVEGGGRGGTGSMAGEAPKGLEERAGPAQIIRMVFSACVISRLFYGTYFFAVPPGFSNTSGGPLDAEDGHGHLISSLRLRLAALEAETKSLRRLAHRARLDRYETDPDTDDSAELSDSHGKNAHYASRSHILTGGSRDDPAVADSPCSGPSSASSPVQDYISVHVDGEEEVHRILLPVEWNSRDFHISDLKEFIIDALGLALIPTSTSLCVSLAFGMVFPATARLTLRQSHIHSGVKVTLKKKPSSVSTPLNAHSTASLRLGESRSPL